MRVSFDSLHHLGETLEELKAKVETMQEQQQEAIEKEEVKEDPNNDKIAEMQTVSDVLQDVYNNLESAYETVSQAAPAEGED